MQRTEVDDMYNRLVRVATHAPGRFIMEPCCIFSDRRMPSTGTRQSSGKAIGALDAPQPRSPPNMGGGNRGAPKTEAEEVMANILRVPEHKIPVRKHGSSGRRSCGVECTPGRTPRLNPSGCSVEVHQGVGVEPHVFEDMVSYSTYEI